MGRYSFLVKDDVYSALNRVRDAFLAAKDGNDVEQIIKGVLTHDERLKIGRRIQIAEALHKGESITVIVTKLNVGRSTVAMVARSLQEYDKCFQLINERRKRLEKEFEVKKHKSTGGSKLVYKKKEYTGITRKDIKR